MFIVSALYIQSATLLTERPVVPIAFIPPLGRITNCAPVFELVYVVLVLVPAKADTVAITVSLVILFISLVSLPLVVVVVMESPGLNVLVNSVDVPVTAVPVTLTVPGLYVTAFTANEPEGVDVPIPRNPLSSMNTAEF